MSQLSVNGIALYYEEHGDGSPILCIHGAGSSALLWGVAVPALARQGRVVVYDRRGCTRSERPEPYRTTLGEQVSDAAALLEALDAAPATIIGRSYGGEIALELTRQRPELVRALALLEPAILSLTEETRFWLDQLAGQARGLAAIQGPDTAADHLLRTFLGEATWMGLPQEICDIFLGNAPALLAEVEDMVQRHEPPEIQVNVPTLIVSGESSLPGFRACDTALARLIPGSRHEIVAGGHLVNPANPMVLDFLRSA